MVEFLKNPFYNALFSGILIYILIIISNKGNPVLGAILSSLPIGVLGLMAIKQKNNIQKFYIRSEIFTNLIIIFMWILINYLYSFTKDTNKIVLIGLLSWLVLSFIFYIISIKKIPI
jgi:hypothetical protein|tara:strand:+ start:64 stop:414 length:351 start_codon:yes stop_codon:yes gene_type:complete